jgi:TPR repeat protein
MTTTPAKHLTIAAIAAASFGLLLAAVHGTDAAAATTGAAPRGESADTDALTPEERLKRNQVSAASGVGDGDFRQEQAKALEGDREAAYRIAQMYKSGSNGVARDERRMLQWLLHASSLNNGAASYQLYQYYLDQKLDRDAIFFENRAVEQGFTPPPRLDPRRG